MTPRELPALRRTHAGAHPRRSSRPGGRNRSLSAVSVSLAGWARKPDAHTGGDAVALSHHWRAHVEAARVRSGRGQVPSVPRAAAQDTRHAARDPLRVLQVPERTRPADHVLRLPERKGFHPPTHAAADRRVATERAGRELLQLRRAD